MKRKVFINHGEHVQMYATESSSSSNTNNCASGCGECESRPAVDGGGPEAVGAVMTGVGTILDGTASLIDVLTDGEG